MSISEPCLSCSSRGIKAGIAAKSITWLLESHYCKDEGICPKSYESVQEVLVEFGTSWRCDGFFLIPSVTCCALIATCKTKIGIPVLQGLRRFYSESWLCLASFQTCMLFKWVDLFLRCLETSIGKSLPIMCQNMGMVQFLVCFSSVELTHFQKFVTLAVIFICASCLSVAVVMSNCCSVLLLMKQKNSFGSEWLIWHFLMFFCNSCRLKNWMCFYLEKWCLNKFFLVLDD